MEKMDEKNNCKTNVTRIQLCGVQGCCPIVEIDHEHKKVVIIDDNGGKVTLSKKQWQEAKKKVNV